MSFEDEGYESSSSLSGDLNSSSDESETREIGSPALFCAAIEATRMSGLKWIRSDEDECEIREFADILAGLGEAPVVHRGGHHVAVVNVIRGDATTVKSIESAMKKKRRRTSPDQLRVLESFFESNKMPSQATRQKLADNLGMSSRRVQIWFQNKRAKLKRTGGKETNDSESRESSLPGSPVHSLEDERYAASFRHMDVQDDAPRHHSTVVRQLSNTFSMTLPPLHSIMV